eukprot:s3328_g5.t1
MLAGLPLDYPSERFQFGLALDFQKAFDSTDAFSAVQILQIWGIPTAITQLLTSQWLDHGDPWSPISLAAVLSGPLRKMQQEHPLVGQMLYLDDRTILGRNVAEVRAVQSSWEQFSTLTRLKTHPSKTQLWGRTEGAKQQLQQLQDADFKECGEVLGAIDGPGQEHSKEVARKETCRLRARRIMSVPGTQKFRQLVANALLTPQAVWGIFITHRPCPDAFLTEFTALFRSAVKGAESRGDRSSRPLQQVFLLGHTSDLALVACTKFLTAVNRWALLKLNKGHEIPPLRAPIPPVMRFVSSFLAAWQWRLDGWG